MGLIVTVTTYQPHQARPGLPMELIVRCDHSLGYPTRSAGRCQLWVGHDGEHAAMFVCDGRRLVRTWLDDPAEAEDRADDYEARAWLRGYPRPEWTE
jgi:hypothetical protein